MNYSKFLKIGFSVLLLIVLLFGFSGSSEIFSSFSGRNLVAKVGGAKITKSEFESIYENEVNSLQLGRELTREEKISFQKEVLKGLVDEKLLGHFISDLNLLVSDETIANEIKRAPVFANPETGVFDKNRFSEMLSQIGKTEHEYLQDMKKSLGMYGFFMTINTRSPMPIIVRDDIILDSLNKIRVIDKIAVNRNKIIFGDENEMKEVENYYREHSDDFKTSEYRKIDYVVLDNKNFANRVKIDESDLRKRAGKVFDSLENKEIRDFYNIVCGDENIAMDLRKKLLDEKNYSEMISSEKNLKEKVGATCRLSYLQGKKINDLPDEFRNFVFELKDGEISEVKKTSIGYSIILLKNAKNIDIETLFPEIREQMKNEGAYRMLIAEVEKLKADLASDKNLKIVDIAKRYDLDIKKFSYFDEDGYYKENTKRSITEDYPISRDIFNRIYQSKVGEVKIEDNRGEYFIYDVVDVILPVQRDFDDVKEDIIEILSSNYKEKKSEELMSEVYKDLDLYGLSVDDVLKKYDGKISIERNKKIYHPEVIRNEEGSRESMMEADIVFSAKEEIKYIKSDDGILVIKGSEKRSMNGIERGRYLSSIQKNVLLLENTEIMESLIKYLRGNKYRVKIYDETLR